MTKEKVESHLLDIALFLDSLQESRILLWTLGSGETQFLDSSLLVKPQKLVHSCFYIRTVKKRPAHSRAERLED